MCFGATTPRKTFFLIVIEVGLLLIVVEKVTSELLCGSRFTDLPSRTVLASIVFEGKVQGVRKWTQSGRNYHNYTFKVNNVLKGRILKSDSDQRRVVVGIFGEKNRTNCIGGKLSRGLSYVVFLSSDVLGTTKSLHIYRISSFPELSRRSIIETVKNYSCSKCARPPNATILAGHVVKKETGKKFQVFCRVSGRPPALVTWTKNNQTIALRTGLRIRRTSHGSKLSINNFTKEDAGAYRCLSVNVLGHSETLILAEVFVVPEKSHSIRCEFKDYCLNNGTCYILTTLSVPYCQCLENFEGERCAMKVIPGSISETPIQFDVAFVMPIVGVPIAAIVIISVSILMYCAIRNRWRRHQIRKTEELSENSYRAYSLGFQEDSLKSSRGKRRSKSGIPNSKEIGTQTDSLLTSPKQLAIVRPDAIPTTKTAFLQLPTASSDLRNASSQSRGRLLGISVTPPDFVERRRRIHTPIAEDDSVCPERTEENAVERSPVLERSTERFKGDHEKMASTSDSADLRRNSEYDNCWVEIGGENSQNNSVNAIQPGVARHEKGSSD